MNNQKKSTRRVMACRVAAETPATIEEIAKAFDCLRMDGVGTFVGAPGVLLDRIAQGKLVIVAGPES